VRRRLNEPTAAAAAAAALCMLTAAAFWLEIVFAWRLYCLVERPEQQLLVGLLQSCCVLCMCCGSERESATKACWTGFRGASGCRQTNNGYSIVSCSSICADNQRPTGCVGRLCFGAFQMLLLSPTCGVTCGVLLHHTAVFLVACCFITVLYSFNCWRCLAWRCHLLH
jgi:hypothetical protein